MTIYYLAHHGTKGQRWGIRRYQNKDGTLTAEGRIHYGKGEKKTLKNQKMSFNDAFKKWGDSESTNVLYLEDISAYRGDSSTSNSFISEMKKQGKVDTVDITKYKSFSWTRDRESNETRSDVINRKIKDGTFDKDLIDSLEKKAPGWDSLHNAGFLSNSKVLLANGYTTRNEMLNKVRDAISEYGANKFRSGSKVIVTGSEIFDLHDNNSDFYKTNPVCIVGNKASSKKFDTDKKLNEMYSELSDANNEESFYKKFDTKRKIKDLN